MKNFDIHIHGTAKIFWGIEFLEDSKFDWHGLLKEGNILFSFRRGICINEYWYWTMPRF